MNQVFIVLFQLLSVSSKGNLAEILARAEFNHC